MIDITPGLSAPQILEQNDYLPFGTKIQNPNHAAIPMNNRWRYAGKEAQRFGSLDLSLLDFGARMYDPFTARWIGIDKMSNRNPSYSPFIYCGAAPTNVYDPDGNAAHIAIGIVVGAAIEGGIAAYHGKSKSEVLGAMARGAIEGGVIAATLGAGTGAALATSTTRGILKQAAKEAVKSAAASAVGSVADQAISNEAVNAKTVLNETAVGFATGLAGSVVNSGTNLASSSIKKKIETTYASTSVKDKIRNEIKHEIRNEGKKVRGSILNQLENERINTLQESEKAFVDFVRGVGSYSIQKNTNSIIEEIKDY